MFPIYKERMQVSAEVIHSLNHYFYKSTSHVEGLSLQALLKLPQPSSKTQTALTFFLYNINPMLTHQGTHLPVKTSLLNHLHGQFVAMGSGKCNTLMTLISVSILVLSINSMPHTASKLGVLRQNTFRRSAHIELCQFQGNLSSVISLKISSCCCRGTLTRSRSEDAFCCLLPRAARVPLSLPCPPHTHGPSRAHGHTQRVSPGSAGQELPAGRARARALPRPPPAACTGTQHRGQGTALTPRSPLQPPPRTSAPGRQRLHGVYPPQVMGDTAPLPRRCRAAALPPSWAEPEPGLAERGGAGPGNVPLTCGCRPPGPAPLGRSPPAAGPAGLGERRSPAAVSSPRGPGRARLWRRSAAVGVRHPGRAAKAAGAWRRCLMPLRCPIASLLLCCPSPRPYLSRSVRAPSWVSVLEVCVGLGHAAWSFLEWRPEDEGVRGLRAAVEACRGCSAPVPAVAPWVSPMSPSPGWQAGSWECSVPP